MKQLDLNNLPKVSYCISTELRDEQIKINIGKVKGRIQPADEIIEEPIAVVCFGGSLKETWPQLKKFKKIMTCSGAHNFLIEKGIIPSYHVDLEPREHKIKMIGTPQKETEYLIASTVHPRYLDALEGFNVKLWHIFATEEDGHRVLPRGEWALTGGSSVGLRCLTMARFLGYRNISVFGMDGSFDSVETTHASEHPNAPKDSCQIDYGGKTFLTTPSMTWCANETWRELDQLHDVNVNFYGEGLVQAMAKNYVQNKITTSQIAFNKPTLISEEFIQLNRKLHEDNPKFGMGGKRHKDTVLKLSKELKTTSILDYGCGKGTLANVLPFPIWEYDPAIPEKSAYPKPADIVVCFDVLEHIEPDKLNFVLDDIKRCTKQVAFIVLSTRLAYKTYSNGINTHSIVEGKAWWEKKLSKFFDIGTIIEKEDKKELHIVVAPKKVAQPDITTLEKGNLKVKFFTPNETTKWRANTLFTKEPATVEWIEQMKPGEVFYDVGANVGSYSILAGAKGLKVYAFEPEAENYALLVKNLTLNNIPPNAYCMALSDEEKAGTLYAGQHEAGGACHSFNESVGHDLQARQSSFTQGCFGVPLDTLVQRGLPSPQHIKIDVDGFEYKVIKGAEATLMNGVKSLLVEVNPSLQEHVEMLEYIRGLGFEYDEQQVESARRKDGTFKGVAEYVFRKRSARKLLPINGTKHICDRVYGTNNDLLPYNHIYVEGLMDCGTYEKLINYIDREAIYIEIEKSRGTKGYPQRYTSIAPSFIKDIFKEGSFKKSLLDKFGIQDDGFLEDVLLVRDLPGYSIPPHTDSTHKVITCLIYIPKDNSIKSEGTSLFVPKEVGFTCDFGGHHPFEKFGKVKTMPFKPNSMFAFARTDNSFHGVEPCEHVRDVLLYNINRK